MAAVKSGTPPPPGGSAGAYPQPSAGSAQPRSGGRTQQAGSSGRTLTGRVVPRQKPGGTLNLPAPKSPGSGSRRSFTPPNPSRVGSAAGQFTSPDFGNYQGIIIAEFIVAELLVAATPIATVKSAAGVTPYAGKDMIKLLSLGLVYFLLELLSVGGAKAGRFAAWFGGLILITVGLAEAANLAKVFNLFGTAAAVTGPTSAGSSSSLGPLGQATQALGNAGIAAAGALGATPSGSSSGGAGSAGVTPNPNVGALFPTVTPGPQGPLGSLAAALAAAGDAAYNAILSASNGVVGRVGQSSQRNTSGQ